MSILIASATSTEIAPFLEEYRYRASSFVDDVDVLITGIGLTAATYSISKQVQVKRPDLIIQAGIAGCFDTGIPLGTVVAIKKELIADQAVMEDKQWKTLTDLQLLSPNQRPYTNQWLVNKSEILKKIKLKKVTAISINEISTSAQKIAWYRERFNPVTESMEGAALHYVALMENIPFVQLRAISNYIGVRNKSNWYFQDWILMLIVQLRNLLCSIR
jgi:futalosine hydrolase